MELEQITSAADITGPVAKMLRKRAKLPQWKFWGSVGVTQSGGCCYEKGISATITESVRTLIYTIYVAGVKIDASSPEGVAELDKLAKLQPAPRKGRKKNEPAATQ